MLTVRLAKSDSVPVNVQAPDAYEVSDAELPTFTSVGVHRLEGGIWRKEAPGLPLAKAFAADKTSSAFSGCASVQKYLATKQAYWVEGYVGFRFSLPVLSADGKEALVLEEFSHGPLWGEGSLIFMRRDAAGAWTVVEKHMTWVS